MRQADGFDALIRVALRRSPVSELSARGGMPCDIFDRVLESASNWWDNCQAGQQRDGAIETDRERAGCGR